VSQGHDNLVQRKLEISDELPVCGIQFARWSIGGNWIEGSAAAKLL
jgi:hypothetical protein